MDDFIRDFLKFKRDIYQNEHSLTVCRYHNLLTLIGKVFNEQLTYGTVSKFSEEELQDAQEVLRLVKQEARLMDEEGVTDHCPEKGTH